MTPLQAHFDMGYDFEKRRLETEWVLNDLGSKQELPVIADFDFYFVPSEAGAQEMKAIKRLNAEGFAAVADDVSGEIWVPVHALTVRLESIWTQAHKTTEIGLLFGYRPDGWGFMEAGWMNLV